MLYIIMAIIIVALDQITKYLTVEHIALGTVNKFIPGVINLTYIQNTGAAFSSFQGMRWVLVVLTVVCIGVMIWAMVKMNFGKKINFTIAMVIGGAIGNGIDRALSGYVVDMIQFAFMTRFPVFNVADCFIVIGGIAFCILYFKRCGENSIPLEGADDEDAGAETENDSVHNGDMKEDADASEDMAEDGRAEDNNSSAGKSGEAGENRDTEEK